MRNVLLSAALFVSAPFIFAACAADQAAPEGDAVESTDEALATSARKVTTHYEGTFTDSGETFTVALDVELPSYSVGFQRMASYFWHTDSPHCHVYNESTPTTLKLRVTGSDGRIVVEKTTSGGTNGFRQLADNECPDGHLANARAFSQLEAEIDGPGVEVVNAGRKIHIPRGYVDAGFLSMKAGTSFTPLSAGKVTHASDSGSVRSDWEIPRGVIRFDLPASTIVSVGVNPSNRTHGYEKIVDVTLRAQ